MPELQAYAPLEHPVAGVSTAWSPRVITQGLLAILAVLVAVLSYRYVLDIGPVPPNIASNRFRTWWLAMHAMFASTALLVGAVQFSAALRERRPGIHKSIGRIYVVSCLLGGVAGFLLALGSSAGAGASIGFGGLAIAWIATNVLGWRSALTRRLAAHRRWMIRSWALTLSAVTLRIYLPIAEVSHMPEEASYAAISFLCWIPNLMVAELVLRRERRITPASMPAVLNSGGLR